MKLIENGTVYEVWNDGVTEFKAARAPVLVWDVSAVAGALGAPLVIAGHLQDFDGERRPDLSIDRAGFMLSRRRVVSPARFELVITGGVLSATFTAGLEGAFAIVPEGSSLFTGEPLALNVNDPAANLVDPFLPLQVTVGAGNSVSVARDPADASAKVRANLFRQFVGGQALAATDRDALIVAAAQLGILERLGQ
jgi:hypothetical protein